MSTAAPTHGITDIENAVYFRTDASAITLPNGDVYVQGGTSGDLPPQVWTVAGHVVNLPFGTEPFGSVQPHLFAISAGRVFGIDGSGTLFYILDGLLRIRQRGQLDEEVAEGGFVSVMYAPDRVLAVGAQSGLSATIDVGGPKPQVNTTYGLREGMDRLKLAVLPDGRVLAANTGWARPGEAHIFTPSGRSRGYWQRGAKWDIESTPPVTGLMLDGSYALDYAYARVLEPPWMAEAGIRPSIGRLSPGRVTPGSTLRIESPHVSEIARVTLVKIGSARTWLPSEQRYLELDFAASANIIDASIPSDGELTPGTYALSILSGNDIPSESVAIEVAPHDFAGSEQGAVFGSAEGTFFTDSLPEGQQVTDLTITVSDGVTAVELVSDTGAVTKRGGDTPGESMASVDLRPWDPIVSMVGTYDDGVRSIGFETLGGSRIGPFGQEDGIPFEVRAPAGYGFAGLRGLEGDRLYAVGMNVRPLPDVLTGDDDPTERLGLVFGGKGGEAFSDQLTPGESVTAVNVRAGNAVDAIQLVTNNGELPYRGGPGGRLTTTSLAEDDFIAGLWGRFSDHAGTLTQIGFRLGSGLVAGPFGAGGGTPFDVVVPAGHEVAGLWGRAGALIDAVGVHMRPRLTYTPPKAFQFARTKIDPGVVGDWHTVSFAKPFHAPPIVVARATASSAKTNIFVTRVRNVTPGGFELRIDPWRRPRHAGKVAELTLAYFAIPPGRYQLPAQPSPADPAPVGRWQVEAGSVSVGPSTQVQLGSGFVVPPVLLTQATGEHTTLTIGRVSDVATDYFVTGLQADEATTHSGLKSETEPLAFMALAQFSGQAGPNTIQVGLIDDVIDAPKPLSFSLDHPAPSAFFADPQTMVGTDPVVAAHGRLGSNGVEIFLREDASQDTETGHRPERVGWFMLSGP